MLLNGKHVEIGDHAYERCQFLRWKGLFVPAPWDPTVQHGNDRSFWCQHTHNCLGPDDSVAADDVCGPDRSCYKAL
jgi:hypothetical protein